MLIFFQVTSLIVIFISFTLGSEQAQTRYLIPSYYGSRDADFKVLGFVLTSNFSSFYWTHGVDFSTSSSTRRYYFIDTKTNQIKTVSSQDNIVEVIANASGGFRNGHLSTALFNFPQSIAYVQQNKLEVVRQRHRDIVVITQDTPECRLNPKSCASTSLNSEIDMNLIVEVFPYSFDSVPDFSEFEAPKLIVADTQNHCIRSIYLESKIVSTIAGICGNQGFKDGPIGTNLLNAPISLGIDPSGIIFFYDGGSDYIRMIDPITTFVSTLNKGSCRQDVRYNSLVVLSTLVKKRVICYKNWLNINGPQGHKYSEDLKSICTLQQSLCP